MILAEIKWQVTDPLGNEIYLTEESFQIHIINDHLGTDAVTRTELEEQVKNSIQNPCFILKSPSFEGRRVYLDWSTIIREDIIHVRPLFIVTEIYGKVVTWFSKRSVKINIQKDGGILYDRRLSDLQVR